MMTDGKDSWWPTPLAHVPKTDFLSEESVIVSEISEGAKSGSTRDLHLALLDPEDARQLTECRQDFPFSYMLGSGLQLDSGTIQVEPLAIKWEGGCNHYVQVPTLAFVEHFRLVPRPLDSAMMWDDLETPQRDIVHAEMVSEYDYPSMSHAVVRIRRDYLLKYADETERAIVALWYEWNSGPNTDCNGEPYQESHFGTLEFPSRRIEFGPSPTDDNVVVAEFWGILPVYFPKLEDPSVSTLEAHLSHTWPGIEQPIGRRTRWHPGRQLWAYVTDSVLARYEEDPDTYIVHVDSGAVSYRNQWSISRCRRVDRDLIAVDLKKLYEGAPDEQIDHWNAHAVSAPSNPFHRADTSVGALAKRIVFELIEMGEALSALSFLNENAQIEPGSFVSLDGDRLKRNWWYDDELIRPITRHIPLGMGREAFLARCKSLTKLVVETLGEKYLRSLLISWNVDSNEIKELGSLKLLDKILQFAKIADEAGLSIEEDTEEIKRRFDKKRNKMPNGEFLPSPIADLFKLYDLRVLDAHRGGTESKVLETMGIRKAEIVSGWGKQLDLVYASVGDALRGANELFRAVIDGAGETCDHP